MAAPMLKIIVRLNEPPSPCGGPLPPHAGSLSASRRRAFALTHSNHAEPEIAHQRPHDGPEKTFRDFSPPAPSTRLTPPPYFSVPHPVMIGLPREPTIIPNWTG
jgi:hypothetical protein